MYKKITTFIGRFSSVHYGHLDVIKKAFEKSNIVLILIGSSGQARTPKNPFTFEERKDMLYKAVRDELGISRDATTDKHGRHLYILPLYDHPYNDSLWIKEVQDKVIGVHNEFMEDGLLDKSAKYHLTGADRDESTKYLHMFGTFFTKELLEEEDHDFELSATKVRDIMFSEGRIPDSSMIPKGTSDFIAKFMKTNTYKNMVDEYKYYKSYDPSKYKVIVQTVDTAVIQSGHILVCIRDNFPGKGLWCLPGGHLEHDELLVDGAIRELKEETKIGLSDAQLYGSIKTQKPFDHVGRSLKCRVITNLFVLKLDDSKPLPKVKAQKGEVAKVIWMPISEALSNTDKWFDDHLSMVQYAVTQ
jgi:bifunctional NMN adenylyltransferase/nudix hydrolase